MRLQGTILAAVALILTTGPPASSSHPTRTCLDIDPEVKHGVSNDDIADDSLRASPGATDAGHPPEHEGCVTEQVESGQNWGGTNIDFEIIGDGDPDASDSPDTPDLTCTVPEDRG